jgi:deoxyribodipyrimidine photo-lyase
LAGFDVTGYAGRRNEVWPASRRGASALSPWIRHGLLPLPEVWATSATGPARDVAKYHDELLWQEYARHLYARLGTALSQPLRARRDERTAVDPWPAEMACMDLAVDELHRDGWLVNQTRMWLASQWSVRHGAAWREGEEHFFRHLLDGSRAANRLGWQWTVGTGTARSYGFSRWQVTKRAPGLCDTCSLRRSCPVQTWPDDGGLTRIEPDPRLRFDPDLATTSGPDEPKRDGRPEGVWMTAESLDDDDPALAAHPELPAVFVFDAPLLRGLQLSAKRLVFLAESLADLSARRTVEVLVGDPVEVLAGRRLAATFAPVPGWRRRRAQLDVVEEHPWPWLRRPAAGPIGSFSAWRRMMG